MEKLLTVEELSKILQVRQSTVYKWVHYQYIPHVKIGSLVRFRSAKIERWIEQRAKKGRKTYKLYP